MTLNKAILIGNLTRNPETRTTTSGQSVTSFGVATNRSWTDANGIRQDKAEFHNIVVWGKLAEICQQYLTKGRKVYIEGRIQNREWEDKDGTKKNRSEIVAENMIMLDRSPDSGGQRQQTPFVSQETSSAQEDEIKVEEIPF